MFPCLPSDKHSVVMMGHSVFRNAVSISMVREDGLLPLAEAVQGLIGMVVDLQVRLDRHKSQPHIKQYNNNNKNTK